MSKIKSKKEVKKETEDFLEISRATAFLFIKEQRYFLYKSTIFNSCHTKGSKPELIRLVCEEMERTEDLKEIILEAVKLFEERLKKEKQ
jgi:hypothetical protein